jgi:hypothetical protein
VNLLALVRTHRPDPVTPVTGGPSGNARLTAWLGMALLVGFAIEGVTLLDVHGLVSWHVAVGMVLIPVALVKTVSTVWRFARYYTGNGPYRRGGPPPLVLRLLGPLVVLATLALLGTGVALIVLGPAASRQHGLFSVLTLHKVAFVGWLGVTGLHVVGRGLVAFDLTLRRGTRVPGRTARFAVLAATAGVAVLAVSLAAPLVPAWHQPFGIHSRR